MASLYPAITFRLNLKADLIDYLHPDRYQSDQDLAIQMAPQHDAQHCSWLPGFLRGENIEQIDQYTFTAYGQKALYLKNNFTSGANAFLEIVSD